MVHQSSDKNKQSNDATKHQFSSQLFPAPHLCAGASRPCSVLQNRRALQALLLLSSSTIACSTSGTSSMTANTPHRDPASIKSTQRNFDFHKNNVWCITKIFKVLDNWLFIKTISWAEIEDGHSLSSIPTSFSDELAIGHSNSKPRLKIIMSRF